MNVAIYVSVSTQQQTTENQLLELYEAYVKETIGLL